MTSFEEKREVTHVESVPDDAEHGDRKVADFDDDIVEEAMAAEAREREMGMWACIQAYPRACFWSVMLSMCVVMEGYDNALISNLYAMTSFKQHYGVANDEGVYQVTAGWQSALSQSPAIGAFIGILFSGWASDRFGYKKTVLFGLILMTGAIFLTFFANHIWVLLIGEIACGFPWGMFVALAPAYASDVSPVGLRGFLTVYVQMCWCIGQFVASGVLFSVQGRLDMWAYRIPFAVQWAWPVPIFAIICLAPESPWWLVRRGRFEDAAKVLQRLYGHDANSRETQNTIAMMRHTNQVEIDNKTGTSYRDCFKGIDLRRTCITCFIFACQPLSGLTLGNQATYFFTVAGLDSSNSFKMGLGNNAIAFLGVIFSWFLVAWFGRRTLYIGGVLAGALTLFLVAILDTQADTHPGIGWGQAALLIIYNFVYDCAIGPLTYLIIAEVPSTRLRAKTVGLSRNAYYITHAAAGVASPYMINPSSPLHWRGKVGFFWGGMAILVAIGAWFLLPECKGRNYRELDILFHRKTPARQFKSTVIADDETE